MGLISRVSSRTYRNFFANMVFTKFVEIGRIAFTPASGQIAAIGDGGDNRHVILDGPTYNRQKVNLNRIQLTKLKLNFLHGARTKTVVKAWNAENMDSQWADTHWAKVIAKKATRASLSDFQR